MRKRITILTALIIALGMCGFGIAPAFAADIPNPALTDGAGLAYANACVTVTSEPIDVFVSLDPDTSYYYLINDIDPVEVFYNGATGNPTGSYFDGSLVNNTLVMTIGSQVDRYAGIPLNSAVGNKITVPAKSVVLTVIAYKGDATSDIYRHIFRFFKAEKADGKITATVDVEKDIAPGFGLYIGVYNARGALSFLDYVKLTASGSLTTDISKYASGDYKYRVFWWDRNFVPLGKEKSL